jgi:hypothetical protein
VNTYTQVTPGATIRDGEVYGPHASSHDEPSSQSFASYNRTLALEPKLVLKLLVGWPLILLVTFISYVPWFAAIYLMIDQTFFLHPGLNRLESVVFWFASPQRIIWHAVARVIRAVCTPLIHLSLGILVKRMMGLNREGPASENTQWSLLRRYVNSTLLSRGALRDAFSILGTHYEATSVCLIFK